ncbi:MAG: hypothetical protein AB1585_13320 [Thermodesulfobacteriota bacterium]
MIWFIIGLFVGASVGVVVLAMIKSSVEYREQRERQGGKRGASLEGR